MKKLFIILAVTLLAQKSFAEQDTTFVLGDRVFNFSIGLGSALYSGNYYKQTIPPLAISYEKAKEEDFLIEDLTLGLGGYFSYGQYKWNYSDDWGYRYNHVIIGARAVLHYPLVEKLDLYTGLFVGAKIILAKEYGSYSGNYNYTRSRSGVAYDWFIGGRYYFKENMALLAELGFGITYFNIGIAIKTHK